MGIKTLVNKVKQYQHDLFKRKVAFQMLSKIVACFENKSTFMNRLPLITYVASVYMADEKVKAHVDKKYGVIPVSPNVIEALGKLNKSLDQPIKVDGDANALLSLGNWFNIIHVLMQHESKKSMEQAVRSKRINTQALNLLPQEIEQKLSSQWRITMPIYKLIDSKESLCVSRTGISYEACIIATFVAGIFMLVTGSHHEIALFNIAGYTGATLSWLTSIRYMVYTFMLEATSGRKILLNDIPHLWSEIPTGESAGAAYIRGMTSSLFDEAEQPQLRFMLSPQQSYVKQQLMLPASNHTDICLDDAQKLMADLFGAKLTADPDPTVITVAPDRLNIK